MASVQVAAFGHHSFASKLMTQEFDKDSMPTTNVLSRAMPNYTILKDGHPISVEDGEKPLEQGAAFIAVPQKIRILINFERSGQALHELSAPIDGKVADLKHALSSRRVIDFPAAEALIYDLRGNLLQDPSLLSASYDFSPSSCRLTCTRKVNQTGGPVAADLEKQWQTVDAAAEVSDRLQERLQSAVSSTLASEGGKGLEAEEELQTSSYDAFTRRLPAATHPPTAPPRQLNDIQARFAAAAPPTSECPALGEQIVVLVKGVTAKLGETNPPLAARCAGAVEGLLDGVTHLATRVPREHRHGTHFEQIFEAEEALDLHRNIRAGKVQELVGTENFDARRRAEDATSAVSCRCAIGLGETERVGASA
jgi:hypothetical protein